jgi:hypothetical protein
VPRQVDIAHTAFGSHTVGVSALAGFFVVEGAASLKSVCTISQHTNPKRQRGPLFNRRISSLTLRVDVADARTVI